GWTRSASPGSLRCRFAAYVICSSRAEATTFAPGRLWGLPLGIPRSRAQTWPLMVQLTFRARRANRGTDDTQVRLDCVRFESPAEVRAKAFSPDGVFDLWHQRSIARRAGPLEQHDHGDGLPR